jgi:hypothetical protein
VLLDIGTVLAGIGLAVIGFVVVIVVCVLILRLLAAILPSYEDRTAPVDPDQIAPDADQSEGAPENGVADVDREQADDATAPPEDEPVPAPATPDEDVPPA